MVSFRSTLFRSRSCFTGDSLWISSLGRILDLSLTFINSKLLAFTTWPLFLPFPSTEDTSQGLFQRFSHSLLMNWLRTLSSMWFLISIFKFKVLGFLFVSFRSILFHSHSCYAGDFLWLLIRNFPLTLNFLSIVQVRFRLLRFLNFLFPSSLSS